MTKVLYFANYIILKVERFEINILLQSFQPIDDLVVQVQFFIHLRVLVKSVDFA